jgi:polar amino acid transport system permease protein
MGSDWVGPVVAVMLKGLQYTLALGALAVVISVALGIILGILTALPDNPATRVLKIILQVYLQVMRGLPLIVTLFIVFFVSPAIGINFGSFTAATVGLSLWGSANVMAVAKGAVSSIPKGQRESAAALGFGWIPSMAWVIFPQAVRRMTPSTVNLVVDLIQATTLASLIGVMEILARSRQAVEFNQLNTGDGHAVAIFGAVLAVFFVICFPLTRMALRLERQRIIRRRRQLAPTEPPALVGIAADSVPAGSYDGESFSVSEALPPTSSHNRPETPR